MDDRPIHDDRLDRDLSCRPPAREPLVGETVRLEPVDPTVHAGELFDVSRGSVEANTVWQYLPAGPFTDVAAFRLWLESCAAPSDPLAFAIRDLASDKMMGMASFMRIEPAHGVIEIGFIWFGPRFQRTRQSTEALFLMMDHALGTLGYRRLEWKSNALNERSRTAAVRLGFRFEGVFHQHMVVKGRNRDTAWFSILDDEWPALRASFLAWLAPSNFDADGRQRRRLGDFR